MFRTEEARKEYAAKKLEIKKAYREEGGSEPMKHHDQLHKCVLVQERLPKAKDNVVE